MQGEERRDRRQIHKIECVQPSTSLTSALGLLLETGASSLPVTDEVLPCCCTIVSCVTLVNCTVLCCTVLYSTVLFCSVLYTMLLHLLGVLCCPVLYCLLLCDLLYTVTQHVEFTLYHCTAACISLMCCAARLHPSAPLQCEQLCAVPLRRELNAVQCCCLHAMDTAVLCWPE